MRSRRTCGAGEFAVARSGYDEALGHLAAALEQVELLSDDAARKAIELRLRVKIGPALIALRGMAAVRAAGITPSLCRFSPGLEASPLA